jgi:hypothetical protein
METREAKSSSRARSVSIGRRPPDHTLGNFIADTNSLPLSAQGNGSMAKIQEISRCQYTPADALLSIIGCKRNGGLFSPPIF